jgi:hypothetical protein
MDLQGKLLRWICLCPGTFNGSIQSGEGSPPPEKRSKVIAAKLFCRMTNFVASNHGWHKGTNLVPSNYLDVEIMQDQIDLLNPTPRDVQVGAIVDQCAESQLRR